MHFGYNLGIGGFSLKLFGTGVYLKETMCRSIIAKVKPSRSNVILHDIEAYVVVIHIFLGYGWILKLVWRNITHSLTMCRAQVLSI